MPCTTTETIHGSLKEIKFDFTSDVNGRLIDEITTNTFNGEIVTLYVLPDAATPPADDWDFKLTDRNGAEIVNWLGYSQEQAASGEFYDRAVLGSVVESKITLNVRKAGNAKAAVIILHLR